MFDRTDHPLAPWDIISAEQKRSPGCRCSNAVNRRIEQGMRRCDLAIPDPSPG